MHSKSIADQAVLAVYAPRILVAEDEFLIRTLVADHLREVGFLVIEAFNGDEAIDILKSGVPIDLVFTDVRMPGATDGLGVLRYVKATNPELPVVMTSGHLSPRLAYAGGAVDFIPKPSDLEVITSAIRAALDQST